MADDEAHFTRQDDPSAYRARLLRDGLSLDHDLLRVEERMREICFGEAEGMTREEIDAAFPAFWEAYEAGRTDAFPGGEPRASFTARVAAAYLSHLPSAGGSLLPSAVCSLLPSAVGSLLMSGFSEPNRRFAARVRRRAAISRSCCDHFGASAFGRWATGPRQLPRARSLAWLA